MFQSASVWIDRKYRLNSPVLSAGYQKKGIALEWFFQITDNSRIQPVLKLLFSNVLFLQVEPVINRSMKSVGTNRELTS